MDSPLLFAGAAGDGYLIRVYRGRSRLQGLPSFTPRLHAFVALVPMTGDARGRVLLADFLPKHPTKIETALALFRGGDVDASVRLRSFPEHVMKSSLLDLGFAGVSSQTLTSIEEFNEQRKTRLSLLGYNCYSYEEELLRFLDIESEY
ncbi:hypothetical protein NDN08_005612 [Rhodosorus marinus]|uniref:Uncharacterized protein n=1 Tax=Rhodosorus marinus TaxID=101924 RepID=A0AAV8V223_9RHOD|nr:hypothetical protein NDN08_005612 [Rhodosorus marinus]